MRFDNYTKAAAEQYLSNDDLAMIRKSATTMVQNIHTQAAGAVLLKLLNHINLVTSDNSMVDVLALQEKLADRETRLRAMERAYFEKVVEVDQLKERLEVMV